MTVCSVREREKSESDHPSIKIFFVYPQEVCPWNKFDWQGGGSPLWGASVPISATFPVLKDLLGLTEAEFLERFSSSAVKRIGRDRLLRNVCVALGNVGDASALPQLRRALETESELVREHASWAIQKIEENNLIYTR